MSVLSNLFAIFSESCTDNCRLQNALASALERDSWQSLAQIRATIKTRGLYGSDWKEVQRLDCDSHLKATLMVMERGQLIEKYVVPRYSVLTDFPAGEIVYKLSQHGLMMRTGTASITRGACAHA